MINKKTTFSILLPQLQPDPLIERHSSIIESFYAHRQEGMFILNNDFELTYMNDAAIELVISLFDVKFDDTKTFLEHVPFERKSYIIKYFSEAFKGITTTYDKEIFDPVQQKNRWVTATYFPVREHNSDIIRSAALELKDITDLKASVICMENKMNNKIKDLAKATTAVLETQRRHIANKLHEDINQSLAAIKMMLSINTMPNDEDTALNRKMRDVLNDVVNDLNKICHDINPDVLEYIALNTLVWDIISRFNAETNVRIKLEDKQYNGESVSSHIGLTLLRVVQDVLYNLVHLTCVQNIDIVLSTRSSHVDLMIVSCCNQADLEGIQADPFVLSLIARCIQQHGDFKLEWNEGKIMCKVSIPLSLDEEQVA